MIDAAKTLREQSARRSSAFASAANRACTAMAAIFMITVTAMLCACGDDAPREASPHAEQHVEKPALHRATWIKNIDGVAPEHWLASREAGRDLDLYDSAVRDMGRIIEVAAKRFRDQPRMIANRAVQLEAMLAEKNIAERAPRLIVTLSQIPGPRRSVESFAAITQQYYNLRVEGLRQGPAIDALKTHLHRTPPEPDAR
jgi:hypothetical protein